MILVMGMLTLVMVIPTLGLQTLVICIGTQVISIDICIQTLVMGYGYI